MRRRESRVLPSCRTVLMGGLVLASSLGCATGKLKDTDTAPDTQASQGGGTPTTDASTPTKPSDTTGAPSPWQQARVGDRVTYSFAAHHKPLARGARSAAPAAEGQGAGLAGRVSVEVAGVEAPWVWLTVSFTNDSGAPLSQARLARTLTLPMRTEETQKLEAPRSGTESTEQLSAAGRNWEAKRYIEDNRPADGPLRNRLYATSPGPLYLTNGLLDASTTLSGFGASGSYQLTLVEFRQGGTGAGASPGLERPLGPGTWYDVKVDGEGNSAVQRTCLGAERGLVLKTVGAASGSATCSDFSGAEVLPLEEVLLSTAWEALVSPWPPPAPEGAAPAAKRSVDVGGHSVPVTVYETAAKGDQLGHSETYAADPWDASLSGLALEARFQPLGSSNFKALPRGKREAADGMTLSGWGQWVPGASR